MSSSSAVATARIDFGCGWSTERSARAQGWRAACIARRPRWERISFHDPVPRVWPASTARSPSVSPQEGGDSKIDRGQLWAVGRIEAAIMKPAPFEYIRPTTLAEACRILAQDEDARVLAGGQTLIPLLAMRLARPTMLVDIGRLPELGGMTREGDCIVVGATTRQADAERAALIAEAVPLLAKALPWVGHPATRNRGTIGGSIANADPSAEIPLVAVTLGAQIVTDDGGAVVSSAADDFFVGPMLTAIRPAACVTQIRFPVWSHGRVGVGFHEVSTRRSDFALVSAAAQVALNDAGRCVDVAVGVGGAGDRPVRLEVSSLRLSALDPAAISMAVTTAVADLEVSHDRYVSAAYRRRAAAVLLNRALNDARDDAKHRAADVRGEVR